MDLLEARDLEEAKEVNSKHITYVRDRLMRKWSAQAGLKKGRENAERAQFGPSICPRAFPIDFA